MANPDDRNRVKRKQSNSIATKYATMLRHILQYKMDVENLYESLGG